MEGLLVYMRSFVAVVTLSAAVLLSGPAAAQQVSSPSAFGAARQGSVPPAVQNAENNAEDLAHRFGFGVRAGIGLDPEIIDFGAHATFGPIFNRGVSFRPGIEFGVGEVTTMFGVNLDLLYTLSEGTGDRWTPYLGIGPNFGLSHRGFQAEGSDADNVDTDTDTDTDTEEPSRFDFSDTDFNGGLNFIVGMHSRRGTFFEMNATAYGVSNIRLLVGFTF